MTKNPPRAAGYPRRNKAITTTAVALALLTLTSGAAHSGPPVTDDFTRDTSLAPAVWHKGTANGGKVTLAHTSAGTVASLTVPGGTADHSVNNPAHATLLTQNISDMDFNVEVEFTSEPTQPWQGQGLLVQQDDAHFIRIGTYTDACQAYLYAAQLADGTTTPLFTEPITNGPNLYLRLARFGPTWYFDYSYTGNAWTYDSKRTAAYDAVGPGGRAALTFTADLTVTKIGLYAENSPLTGTAHEFTATAAYFLNLLQPPPTFHGAPYPPPTPPPQITLWYGPNQTTGAHGVSQPWFNLLGNVQSARGLAAITYTLNGGPATDLSWGETSDRLVGIGDIDADIPYALLKPGPNTVTVTATDYAGQTTQQTVSLTNLGNRLPSDAGSFTLDFSQLTNETLLSWVQIVDGTWALGPDHRLQTTQRGYDRAFAIGDTNLTGNYDLWTEFVLRGYTCAGGVVGVATGWQGHTLDDYGTDLPYQPTLGHPFPNFAGVGLDGWYSIQQNLAPLYETVLNETYAAPIALNTPYLYHYRQTANPDGQTYHSSLNIWPKNTPEPAGWLVEADTPARPGSLLFDAHQFDVSWGPIIVFTRL